MLWYNLGMFPIAIGRYCKSQRVQQDKSEKTKGCIINETNDLSLNFQEFNDILFGINILLSILILFCGGRRKSRV